MEHISNINAIKKPVEQKEPDTLECTICHTQVKFADKQYRRHCPKCGLSISRSIEKQEVKQRIKENCFICKDTGVIPYHAQVGDRIYEYVARCDCQAGINMYEAIPTLAECSMAPTMEFIKNQRAEG